MGKKRQHKQTITQQIMADVYTKLAAHEHDLTRKQHARQTKQYIKFCREKYSARTFEECSKHIQNYSDHLHRENYTASTIHTYLAAVCNVFEIKLDTISKPTRHVSDYQKGRNNTQRILPEDEEFVVSYFENIAPEEKIFDVKYFKNDLNLHALRAESARRYYNYQLQKMKENPSYRAQLEKEIYARWNEMNKNKNGKIKPFIAQEMYGVYTLRSKNRALAKQKGLPVHYDKTALLATSIFKLSH